MAVKHISGIDAFALCGIKSRSGSDRWDNSGNTVFRGRVEKVVLVEISYELQLGASGVLCRKCVKKWKANNQLQLKGSGDNHESNY